VSKRVRRKLVVLDYGSGNLRSAQRALERVGADVTVTADLTAAAGADGLVVPGVGAYAACMGGIDALGAGRIIAERVAAGAPVLGICVGMQILFEAGEEHGVVTKGLGLLPGSVTRLSAPVVPHMGWNTVSWPAGSVLGAGLDDAIRFYFVHSYAARPAAAASMTVSGAGSDLGAAASMTASGAGSDLGAAAGADSVRYAVTRHGEDFAAAVEHGVLAATQFHPEKSGDAGATLLTNWIGAL
jgi:imidazole glycerol-phosphate synthase subunit HisH